MYTHTHTHRHTPPKINLNAKKKNVLAIKRVTTNRNNLSERHKNYECVGTQEVKIHWERFTQCNIIQPLK